VDRFHSVDSTQCRNPHHRSGKLRILAVFGDKRSNAVPEVTTAIEAGVPGMVATRSTCCSPQWEHQELS
jgi:tripartite-type tricarboxylate transporter receptor subunit TctC